MLYLPFAQVQAELETQLLRRGCPDAHARATAREIARNSLEGVYTHGVNRFARLLRNIDDGIVRLGVEPISLAAFGAMERLDGQQGFGVVNAAFAMERAVTLAQTHGIGLVALRNTNHWMRAATYGYQACEAGMAAMCFTNTMPNMPAWGAVDARLGNNPLVLAIPNGDEPVLLDMAASQFSYGALELARLQGRQMPIDAGFDRQGNLTRDPDEIIQSRRILPMGYWKGAGLSVLLDLFAGCLSLGNTTYGIGKLSGDEHGLSQVFIAIHYTQLVPKAQAETIIADTLAYIAQSAPDGTGAPIRWPGNRVAAVRERNLTQGIPVDERVWESILAMRRQA